MNFSPGCLIIFVAFIPFFAVKELGRVLGEDKIRALFWRGANPIFPDSRGAVRVHQRWQAVQQTYGTRNEGRINA